MVLCGAKMLLLISTPVSYESGVEPHRLSWLRREGCEELWGSAAPTLIPLCSTVIWLTNSNSTQAGERIHNYMQGKCVYVTKLPKQKKVHFYSNIMPTTCLIQWHLLMTGKKTRSTCVLENDFIGWMALQTFAVLLLLTGCFISGFRVSLWNTSKVSEVQT